MSEKLKEAGVGIAAGIALVVGGYFLFVFLFIGSIVFCAKMTKWRDGFLSSYVNKMNMEAYQRRQEERSIYKKGIIDESEYRRATESYLKEMKDKKSKPKSTEPKKSKLNKNKPSKPDNVQQLPPAQGRKATKGSVRFIQPIKPNHFASTALSRHAAHRCPQNG